MEKDPLLPLLSPRNLPAPPPALSLPTLPEHEEFSLNLGQTPSSLKDRLIFGPPLSPRGQASSSLYEALNLSYSSPRPSSSSAADIPFLDLPQSLLLPHLPQSPSSQVAPLSPTHQQQQTPHQHQQQQQWLVDPNYSWKKRNLHRSKTAPAMAVINDFKRSAPAVPRPKEPSSMSIIRQACILLILYLSLGVLIYWFNRHEFAASETHPVVDALYFCIVTMCTIGYGDITPNSTATKLFSIFFVFVGFGFIDILLSGMVSYMLDLQENYLLKTVQAGKDVRSIIIDVKKGRMRIRMKVGLALGVVVMCIGIGVAFLHFVEHLGLLDAFYLSVMSVTTVGYGDRAFKTLPGRIFASIWLLVSTLAVARAFLYLAEARVDKRHRNLAKWVLGQDMTVAQFLAADINNNGFVSKSEYVIYKLKEMGKISEKDILQVCKKFDQLDSGNFGKITLADLMEHKQ